MENTRTTLKNQLENFENGIILDADGTTSVCYNFYDWFCTDKALERKSKDLFGKVKTFLKHHTHIDLEKTYVFFKNNCPVSGNNYDSFSICEIETGKVLYWVTPRSGHYNIPGSERAEIFNAREDITYKDQTLTKLYKQLKADKVI